MTSHPFRVYRFHRRPALTPEIREAAQLLTRVPPSIRTMILTQLRVLASATAHGARRERLARRQAFRKGGAE